MPARPAARHSSIVYIYIYNPATAAEMCAILRVCDATYFVRIFRVYYCVFRRTKKIQTDGYAAARKGWSSPTSAFAAVGRHLLRTRQNRCGFRGARPFIVKTILLSPFRRFPIAPDRKPVDHFFRKTKNKDYRPFHRASYAV